jgi:hypothetical protein
MPKPVYSSPTEQDPSAQARRKRDEAARDLVAALERLSDIAEEGLRDHSPAGWNAARAALTEAGRLQMGLSAGGVAATPPTDGDLVGDEDDGEPMLDEEAWLARFAPRSPES